MRRCNSKYLLVLAGFLVALTTSCGDEEGTDDSLSVRATFTLTDGSRFHFDQPAAMDEVNGSWVIEAYDMTTRYGVVISWSADVVTQAGEYDADMGLDQVQMWIGRPNPEDDTVTRLSTVSSGRLAFDRVSYQSGELVSGTFDEVVLSRDDPDDNVLITLTDGSFSALVP